MDANDRKLFVQVIGQLVLGDGAVTDAEREYLDSVMTDLGMSPEEGKAAMAGVGMDSPIEERVRQMTPEARAHLLPAAQRAVQVNGEASRAERELLEIVERACG